MWSELQRPRKRRIRNEYGQWVDEKELQGKTIQVDTPVYEVIYIGKIIHCRETMEVDI